MTRNALRHRGGALALILGVAGAVAGAGACAAYDITMSLARPCSDTSPDERFRGTWLGTLGGRPLQLELDRVCTGLNFQSFWSIEGAWRWGSASSGSATLFDGAFYLKTNAIGEPFRGLTLAVRDSSGSADTVYGVATGELPLTSPPSGAWQAFTGELVMIVRR